MIILVWSVTIRHDTQSLCHFLYSKLTTTDEAGGMEKSSCDAPIGPVFA
jgi:hypothetical protein